MNPIVEFFLLPLSPVVALATTAVVLIMAECVPALNFPRVKTALAVAGTLVSLYFALFLLRVWPIEFATTGVGASASWIVEFAKSYYLNSTTLVLYAAIAVFTGLSLLFLSFQFATSTLRTEVQALTLFVACGMMLLVSANTLIMVFLALELMSLPTYILVGIQRRDRLSCEAALKYFLFGSFATVLLVFGIALLYAQLGTLSLPLITERLSGSQALTSNPLALAAVGLLMIATAFKVGAVPFHMWVPDTYQGAPTSVTGFMGSAVKLAGFGLALRLFGGMLSPLAGVWAGPLVAIAVLTILVGNLAALAQDNLKRLFAYSSISHAGFLLLEIAVGPAGTAANLTYYLVVYGLMFLGLFAGILLVETQTKSADISVLSGFGFTHPLLGAALALFALSAAGLPPTAGFFAKYFIFADTVRAGYTWAVVLGLLGSLIGAYYYLRVLVYLYMKEAKDKMALPPGYRWVSFGITLAALGVIFFSFQPAVLSFLR